MYIILTFDIFDLLYYYDITIWIMHFVFLLILKVVYDSDVTWSHSKM